LNIVMDIGTNTAICGIHKRIDKDIHPFCECPVNTADAPGTFNAINFVMNVVKSVTHIIYPGSNKLCALKTTVPE